MIKEWKKSEDGKFKWTGRIIRPFEYGNNCLYEGDDPVVFILEDDKNNCYPLRAEDVLTEEQISNIRMFVCRAVEQNAPTTSPQPSGASEIEKEGGSEG